MPKLSYVSCMIVAHAFNPIVREAEAVLVSLSPASSTKASSGQTLKLQKNPVSKKQKKRVI